VYYKESSNNKYYDNYKNKYLTDAAFLKTFAINKKKNKDFCLEKKFKIILFFISFFYKNKEINFLDYGSGSIENFFYLKSKFKNLKYIYFDKKENNVFYKKKCEEFNLENFEILNNQSANLIYFGSSLQYIPELKILNDINFKKTKFIIITDTPFLVENKKFKKIFISQRNINKPINCIFYSKKYLLDFFRKKKFIMCFEGINTNDSYLNFNEIKYKCENLDIILKKN
jgi:hypothetical protein